MASVRRCAPAETYVPPDAGELTVNVAVAGSLVLYKLAGLS